MVDKTKEGENAPSADDEVLQSETVQKAISDAVAKAVEENTKGLEENRNAILAEKRELSEQLKAAQEQAKQFDGLDVNKIRTMIEAVEKSDEAKLISEGKIDEVIESRISSAKNAYEQQFQEKDVEIQSLAEQNAKLQNMYESKLIGDAIQAEALRQGMLPEAITDAVNSSQGLFKLGEDGSVQAAKVDEFINSPERFIKSLKETKPYYWPANADFRLNGSGGGDAKDIASRMEEAAAAGDFDTYKKLRAQSNKANQ